MPPFLVKIFQVIATWLLEKLVAGIRQWVSEQAARKRRESEIKEALKPYLASKTPKEQEDAFQELLRHMRG